MKSKYNSVAIFTTWQKLWLLAIILLTTHIGMLSLSNIYFFHLPYIIPAVVFLIPIIAVILYALGGSWSTILERMAHCKYSKFCSYYFSHQPSPVMNPDIDIDSIKSDLRSGDILLRRNTYYLDELIFSQNSFFTHVGICERADDTAEPKVWHVTSKLGVDCTSLASFCQCETVAVLRFSFENSKAFLEVIEKNNSMKEEEFQEIQDFIINHVRRDSNEPDLSQDELKIFGKVREYISANNFSIETITDTLQSLNYNETVMRRATTLKGYQYDWKFNFKKFDTFSCIEYVWYSFKSLSPLHQIRTEDFEFFKIVMPVIVPDIFMKNPFFKLISTSIPGIGNDKQLLLKRATPEWWRIWRYGLNILIWDAIILFASLQLHSFLYYFIATFIIIKLIDKIPPGNFPLRIPNIFVRYRKHRQAQ